MIYNHEDLLKCAITQDMLLKWFWECFNEKEGDVLDKNNMDLEVKINGKVLDSPLRYLIKAEKYINQKVDQHCKTLVNFEDETNKLIEEKAEKLLEDKVYDLQNNIQKWLDMEV